jgi:phospholipid transport system transporter-binding protein
MTAAAPIGFSAESEGHFSVSGRLGFDTVPTIWDSSRSALGAVSEARIDLGDVTEVDSAGLALVLEWIASARAHGRRLQLTRAPSKLMALSKISEVDAFLAEALSD